MRVLYATDGSIPGRRGEELITALFEPTGLEVHVLSVEPEMIFLPDTLEASAEFDKLSYPLRAEGLARESAERLIAAGMSASWSYTSGAPGLEILRLAERETFDLVVLGASHATWLGNVLLGSVSTHVLHQSPCPVVVTHRTPSGTGRVLFAVDGSECAQRAASFATRLFDPARVQIEVAMTVTEPWTSVAVYPPGLPLGDHAGYEKALQRMMDAAWQSVQRVARDVHAAGFRVDPVVLQGSPASQLLKETDNFGADLVVLGSRGRGAVKRALLGSVSDQVARHAPAALVWRRLQE